MNTLPELPLKSGFLWDVERGSVYRRVPRGKIFLVINASSGDREKRLWGREDERSETFATREIRKVGAERGLSAPTFQEVMKFMEMVSTPDSPVPSIMATKEGKLALLHWSAGKQTLEVEVGENGPEYVWGVTKSGSRVSAESERQKIITYAKRINLEMAALVNEVNPNWRAVYPVR